MPYTVVIPARYGSTRLPGKPLLDIDGKPMVQRVWEQAVASRAERVVIATDDSRIAEAAKAFGADELIDIREITNPVERWLKVRELTDGWGADVVAELVGFPSVVAEGLDMLGNGGRYLEIGNISPMMTCEIDPAITLVINNKSIHGVMFYPANTLKKALDFLSRARDRYPFDKILSCSYALEDINEAFENQDKGHISRSTIIP